MSKNLGVRSQYYTGLPFLHVAVFAPGPRNVLVSFLAVLSVSKVFGLDILDNSIFYHLYISETYILYEL